MKSKRNFETEDGRIVPGTLEDDGIRVVQKINLNDIPPGWAPSEADPLDTAMEAAVLYLAHVKAADPDTLGAGDKRHAMRLHAKLGNLREALDGGDVRHAARAGVAFGKALEEMRERLGATAVRLGRENMKSLDSGRDTYKKKGDKLDNLAWATFKKVKQDKPSLDSERAWCEHAAIELNKEHKESRERALSAGRTPEEVDKQWPKWTMAKVKGRIQKFKK